MNEQKLIRNLAATAVIIMLLLIVGSLVLFSTTRNSDNEVSAKIGDLEVLYDQSLFKRGSLPAVECGGAICLESINRSTDQAVSQLIVSKKTDLTTSEECVGQVSREATDTELNNETLVGFRLDEESEIIDGRLSNQLRVLAGVDCYQFEVIAKVLPGVDFSETNQAELLRKYDQAFDVISSAAIKDYTVSNLRQLVRDHVARVYDRADSDHGPQSQPDLGQPINSVVYEDDEILITFVEIAEDSRCPQDVQCIWQGQVIAELVVNYLAADNEVGLLIERGETIELSNGYTITLVSVSPERTLDSEIRSGDYQISLAVETPSANDDDPDQHSIRECVRAGCSSQLCISAEEAEGGGGVTTCEYRAEYACYETAECEVQPSGECGFTPTQELDSCLENLPSLN